MTSGRTNARIREAWEYPHAYADDPAGQDDRLAIDRAVDTGHDDPEILMAEAITAYWQRHADYAAVWLTDHINEPEGVRDRAFAYKVAAARNARTAGGMKANYALPDLESMFYETRNPLYVWQAIAWGLNAEKASADDDLFGPTELPHWCAAMLKNLAVRLVILGSPGAPAATAANVQEALRLFSQGYSAYAERDRRSRDQQRTDFVAELKTAGMSLQRARAVAFPHIGDPRALRRAGKRVTPRVKPKPQA